MLPTPAHNVHSSTYKVFHVPTAVFPSLVTVLTCYVIERSYGKPFYTRTILSMGKLNVQGAPGEVQIKLIEHLLLQL